SSIPYLGVAPKLMMNPSLEAGTKAIEEALGIFGKREVIAERSVAEVASSNPSGQVLRLRGGGPKKSQPTGGLKSTGDTSDENDADDYASDADSSTSEDINNVLNTHIQDAIETEGRAHVASNVLEKSLQAKKEFKKQHALATGHADMETRSVSSVDSEWIQNTLYKTARMKLGATLKQEQMNLQTPHSPSTKDQELAAKKKMTFLFQENSKLAVEKAQRAEEAAKDYLKEEEEGHQKILADQHATPLDQENSSLNMIYQKALTIQTTSDHEFKKAQRDLAEAKLATVNAEMALQEAQHIQTDLSSLNEAETSFELAREEEEKLEQKIDPITNETAVRNSWCEALKKAFEATLVTNDLREKISSLSLISSLPSSRATNWNNILQEAQATEQTWKEVVEVCNNALDKKPLRKLKIAWEKDLEEAINQQMLWETRIIWFKIGQTVEKAKTSLALQNSQEELLQQAEEMSSIYDDMLGTLQRKQNETSARLQSWWNHDLQQIETQRTVHQNELMKLKARLTAELNEAIKNADTIWNHALDLSRQANIVKASADKTQTESAYQEVKCFAENVITAWVKAEEGKRNVLSKTTDANQKATINKKIQEATNKKTEYTQLAETALVNAQEIEKRRLQEETKTAQEREVASQLARERAEWLEKQEKVKTEVERRIGEIREGIALIEKRIEEATETNGLAWEKVEQFNNQWIVRDNTKTIAKENAERAKADLEKFKEEQDKAEADLARYQEVLRRWKKSPKENVAEAIRKSQEARSKTQTIVEDSLSCWEEVVMSLEKNTEYWKKAFETTQAPLAADYSLAAIKLEQAAASAEMASIYQHVADLNKLVAESQSTVKTGFKNKVNVNPRSIFWGIGIVVASYVTHTAMTSEPVWSGFMSRFLDPDYYQSHKFAHDIWNNTTRAHENAKKACPRSKFDQNSFSPECLQTTTVTELAWSKALEAKSDALQKASWASKAKKDALMEEIKTAQNKQKYWTSLSLRERTKEESNTPTSLPTNPSKPTSVPTVKKIVLKAPFDKLEDQWSPFAQAVKDFNTTPTVSNAQAAQKALHNLRDAINAINAINSKWSWSYFNNVINPIKYNDETYRWQILYENTFSYNKLLGTIDATSSVIDITSITMRHHIVKNSLVVGSTVAGAFIGALDGAVNGAVGRAIVGALGVGALGGGFVAATEWILNPMNRFQTAAQKSYQARIFANEAKYNPIHSEWSVEDEWARRAANETANFAELVSKTKF
ncbi:MAG TPA: hypothetical protein VJK54_03255, partial [Chthoniobacterales bacterium]|nr:hypothetical protein [Chthoniobacterales bacterium]